MVEGRRFPHIRRMARLAPMIQHSRNVVWIRWSGIICGMAWIAVGVHKLIVSVYVARLTRRCRVQAGQRELRRTVIEGRRLPHVHRMASLADAAESAGHVIWIRWRGKICCMTLVAASVRQLVVTIDVTRLTRSGNMSPRQGEFRRTVVEGRRLPHRRRVASRAIVTESCRHVVWIHGRRKVARMALITVGVRQLIVTIDVA